MSPFVRGFAGELEKAARGNVARQIEDLALRARSGTARAYATTRAASKREGRAVSWSMANRKKPPTPMESAFIEHARKMRGESREALGKTAGPVGAALKTVAGGAGKFVLKHPVVSLFGLYPAGRAAASAFGERAAGQEPERVLAAKPGQPSPYHEANFHELFPHKLAPWERFRLHRNYPGWRSKITGGAGEQRTE
jgi:hypothetical protein